MPEGRSFANSSFKRLYPEQPAEHTYEILGALHSVLKGYCAAHGLPEDQANAFFKVLQTEMFAHPDEALNEVDNAAQRLWTSAKKMRSNSSAHQRELCSILNAVIRQDNAEWVGAAAVLARSINQLCVNRRMGDDKVCFPPNNCSFRGGGLPDEHRAFFHPGKHYRVPGFLATSFSEDKAHEFYYRAHQEHHQPAVKWVIKLDARGKDSFKYRCKQVNFVTKTNVAGEEEFLFAPYSVFTVEDVHWGAGDDDDPHVITVLAAIDNKKEPEDLPLAPWY